MCGVSEGWQGSWLPAPYPPGKNDSTVTINKKICIRTFTLREERGICIIKCGMSKK